MGCLKDKYKQVPARVFSADTTGKTKVVTADR
jgi:hypothetical protein